MKWSGKKKKQQPKNILLNINGNTSQTRNNLIKSFWNGSARRREWDVEWLYECCFESITHIIYILHVFVIWPCPCPCPCPYQEYIPLIPIPMNTFDFYSVSEFCADSSAKKLIFIHFAIFFQYFPLPTFVGRSEFIIFCKQIYILFCSMFMISVYQNRQI